MVPEVINNSGTTKTKARNSPCPTSLVPLSYS
jgi:hypothetical protein